MKKNIKLLSLAISVVMASSIFAGCASKTTGGQSSKTIKIGAILPMTGDIASFGKSSKEALDLLAEQVNKEGILGGKKVEFVIQDDENDPVKSANAAQKLIDDGVVGIVGPVASKCAMAAGPVATKEKVVLVSSTATNPDVTKTGGEYVFRACFIDPFQGTILSQFSREELKSTKAAMLYDNGNDYTKGLAEYFKKDFEKNGGKIVAEETYTKDDKDFKALLTKIKAQNPEVILLPDYYSKVGLIAKQARELGITAKFVGGDGWDSPDLVKIAGDSIDGGYFTNHYSPEDTSQLVVDFVKAYKAKYKDAVPDALACLAYDGGKLLIEAIKKANSTDSAKIKDTLKNNSFDLVSGKVKFDENRNPVKSIVILKMDKGQQKFYKKLDPK